jgi:O-methyltransferase involved in polyketide biosynthesis
MIGKGPRMTTNLPSIEMPSSARVYDYFLGGTNHYAIDRDFARQQLQYMPDIQLAMRANRAFVGRAVRHALDRGIRQFVDIGSGLPSQGQAHEVADQHAPDAAARVIYIDKEPIAHAHSKILLDAQADPDRHRAIVADFFDTNELWDAVTSSGVFNADEPTCLLVTAILHFMAPDQQPERAMQYYRDQLQPGSLLVLTHGARGEDKGVDQVVANYAKTTDPAHLRSEAEFAEFFGGWPLLEPGIVWAPAWRPDGSETPWWGDRPERAVYLAGVAEKPA